jgi:hypothetical protein
MSQFLSFSIVYSSTVRSKGCLVHLQAHPYWKADAEFIHLKILELEHMSTLNFHLAMKLVRLAPRNAYNLGYCGDASRSRNCRAL